MVAVIHHSQQYFIADSHARDFNGRPSGVGTAVGLQFENATSIVQYLTSTYDGQQFNLSPVLLQVLPLHQIEIQNTWVSRRHHSAIPVSLPTQDIDPHLLDIGHQATSSNQPSLIPNLSARSQITNYAGETDIFVSNPNKVAVNSSGHYTLADMDSFTDTYPTYVPEVKPLSYESLFTTTDYNLHQSPEYVNDHIYSSVSVADEDVRNVSHSKLDNTSQAQTSDHLYSAPSPTHPYNSDIPNHNPPTYTSLFANTTNHTYSVPSPTHDSMDISDSTSFDIDSVDNDINTGVPLSTDPLLKYTTVEPTYEPDYVSQDVPCYLTEHFKCK